MTSLHQSTKDDAALCAILGIPYHGWPKVEIGLFIDEMGPDPVAACKAASALGLRSYSGRSCTYREQGTHFEDLSAGELRAIVSHIFQETGMVMREFGSRLGKVIFIDKDHVDVRGTVMTVAEYLDVAKRVYELAHEVMSDPNCGGSSDVAEKRVMRQFDTYKGEGVDVEDWFSWAADLLQQKLELAEGTCLTLTHEVEQRLWGSSADNMQRMADRIGQDRYKVVIDIGNLDSTSGIGDKLAAEQGGKLLALAGPHLHIKAHLGDPESVTEAAITRFGPVHLDAAHEIWLPQFAAAIPAIEQRNGLHGGTVMVVLEPHFRAGGQFGGFTGIDLMGCAVRSLQAALYKAQISFALKQYEDGRPDNMSLVTAC